ncbi:hypothetical protein [Lysinibacillus sp. NPDC059133]|uniref:hypothetical protein n=1 Tax=Lysinibacillus sp. NPDC059133 TaxID=3346737 RepID=UPI0036BB6D4E
MDAMTTIAKFAVNGVKNDNGKVVFAIEKGPLVHAPDDYIHIDDLVKEAFPEKWQSFKDKILAATEKQDKDALLEAFKDYNQLVKSIYSNQSHLVQKKVENYSDWQETIKNTVISNHFSRLDKTSLSNFVGDIMTKNSWLSDEFLAKDLKNFQRYLTRNH